MPGGGSESLAVPIVAGALTGLVFLALLAMTVLAVRRRTLQRAGGTVECSLQHPGHARWTLGVGRYEGDTLNWYRLLSLRTRPRQVLSRNHLSVVDQRQPEAYEVDALPTGAVVVTCIHDGAVVELALGEQALTGFLAWLEASPPGTHAPWP